LNKNITGIFTAPKKILIGRLVLLLISSLLAISFYLLYINYIDRNNLKKGPISKNFWANIFYKVESGNHNKKVSNGHNIRHSMMNPGVNLTYWGIATIVWPTKVNINGAGFRDYDFSVNKPDGIFRIVILGDSLVFGLGVNLEDTFPKVLEKLLNKEGNKFEVFNGGIPASNPYTQNLFFQNTFAQYNPDMVLWFYSPNHYKCFDITTAYEMSSGSYLQDNAEKISKIWEALKIDPTITSIESMELKLTTFKQNFPIGLVPEMLNICIKIPLLELKQHIEQKGSRLIYFILEDDPLRSWSIYEYVKVLGIPAIYEQEYIDIFIENKILPERDPHLTIEGHRLMGQWLYKYLKGNIFNEKK
jgi:hypothetical protein